MMRFLFLLSLCAALLAACAREVGPEARIAITQRPGAVLEVVYELRRAQPGIAFHEIEGDYRAARWDLPPGFEIRKKDGAEVIARRDGARFKTLVLTAHPAQGRLPKEYQPVAPYGEGGVLVYTGHFWPLTKAQARADVVFDLTPAPGGHAVAFGDNAMALHDWQSPMAHPAFVYLGPLEPIETGAVMAVIDPQTPGWIVEEFKRLVPESFEKLSAMFGAAPETKPNLFLAAVPGKPAQLSYAGDALPAQFQIMLEGGVWAKPNDQARGVFLQSTVHEAVHLWQAAARPGASKPPEWIHEGAADAIAAEILAALGEWDAAAFEADERTARTDCARELDKGTTLNGARAKGYYRALYACGHVIASAVARAEGASTADFWRAFIDRAGPEGYSEDMFYDLVAERTGDPDFAGAVRDFARKPLARPEREIDGLFAAAGALARERGR
ncbi:hypothetical protein [Hyphococcus luteus]|uniref:Peptidase M61 catalytic domain-containing protein n=1 Tax=Hyphococcus luteus TaxID=2058213 RepID=A0A2S7JZP2_9PROT|nr:hypothetical protein [Marinicaulis flavus]PQA85727.1 hypothetical protein CW354_22645 [Marinicaulis flavus]